VHLPNNGIQLTPSQTAVALTLKYLKRVQINSTAACVVHTNASSFEIPILTFNGSINVSKYGVAVKGFIQSTLGQASFAFTSKI